MPEKVKEKRFSVNRNFKSITENSNSISKNSMVIRRHQLRDDNEKQNVFPDKVPFGGDSNLKAEN
jgi:hypothetical protein